MNIFIIVLFAVGILLFAVGLLKALSARGEGILISASILPASVIICVKLEELKKN